MNKYSKLSPDQLEEHFSNYLIDSWSYSAVSCFARNEKAFEMQYVYREKDTRSISSIAGNAYHEALRQFFSSYVEGQEPAIVDLTTWAYDYLDGIGANEWRLTDKFQTVESAVAEATRIVNALLASFCAELAIYTDEIDRVLAVEQKMDVWVSVNGVDVPLPLHAVADLVVLLKNGRIAIIDHKSKSAYTDEKELALVHGQQAITYVVAYEAQNESSGERVDEVWFVENKISKNKDGGAQLRKHVFYMDADNRRLFEALLYEPLRRMLEAVSNPDYIYTINPSDKLTDMAVLYDFWARTQISEIEDFENIPDTKKELLKSRQRKIKDSSIGNIAPKAITSFRKHAASFIAFDYARTNMTNEEKIEHILRSFNITTKVATKIDGFSCDTYLCEVAAGVELLSVFRHTLDIAKALDVPRVRIQGEPLVMYQGKAYLAIEVNKTRTKDLPWDKKYLEGYRLPLGIDNYGNTIVWNLANNSTPHVLVCGATGSGKSVCLTNILYYALEAGVQDITILDPKYEFSYAQLPSNVRVLSEIADIDQALADMVVDMNERVKNHQKHFSLVIFDEFADAADQSDGTLIKSFKMLLQKGRSAGFRFVAATQRASVKTIPGDIKVNLPVQVCFRVPKGLDSKVVIDTEGAECLNGAGDGLIHSPEYNEGIVRFQAFYRPL